MKKFRISLLWQVLIAIATGIALGQFLPVPVARIFVTFNGLFGNFLTFAIPLIIIGLIIPAISDLGKGAGRLLLVTAAIAYGSTVFSGFFTYFSGRAVFPELITESAHTAAIIDNPGNMALKPYFTVEMPAPLDIMTALLLSFCIGLGLSAVKGDTLRMAAADFRDIVSLLIAKVIIPLLPLHIFGIFLNMTVSGQVTSIISVFVKIIVVIFILHILLLLVQFVLAGIIGRKNPLRLLKNIVSVMSIRNKMGLEDDVFTNASRIIILKLEEKGAIGVIVDEVKEVVNLSEDEIEKSTNKGKFINGIGKHGDDLISLLEINSVVDDNA